MNSCKPTNKSYYEIRSNSKVVKVNGIYEAKVHLLKLNEIDQEIEPVFYVIFNNKDTAYLPYDNENHCAIYRSSVSTPGTKKWNATFEYKTKSGKDVKIEFSDSFVVE